MYAIPPYIDKQNILPNQATDQFDAEFQAKVITNNFDPLAPYNRVMTSFNNFFYLNILNLVSTGYKAILPKPARTGIANFLDNLMFPLRLVNNLLQFKFKNSYYETQRFILNSTIGLAGFIDVANNSFNIKQYNEDLGQTLGFYGIGGGFNIVWPFLGPSNLRDSVGFIADSLINPLNYVSGRNYNLLDNNTQYYLMRGLDIVNYNSLHINAYKNLTKDALDLYPFLQDVYEQRRNKLISE